jgi:hypothetical protein
MGRRKNVNNDIKNTVLEFILAAAFSEDHADLGPEFWRNSPNWITRVTVLVHSFAV